MKTLLTKGRKRATVEIDGDTIIIQELSLADASSLQDGDADEMTTTLRLIVASVVDAEGHKVYSSEDIPALREALSLAVTKQIGEAIGKLNGFDAATKGPKA